MSEATVRDKRFGNEATVWDKRFGNEATVWDKELENERIHTGSLILVNETYGCQDQRQEHLVTVGEDDAGVRLERRTAVLLMELLKKIGAAKEIALVSGWRSFEEQQAIWADSLAENGLEFTRKFVAVPGHSEHETGLAIDLGLCQENLDFICPEFPYEGICGAFRRYAASYGFVERYPAGKEAVTGIGHEPWHFRYVGVPHAFILTEKDLTLEEYMDFLKDFPYGSPYRYQKNGLDVEVSWLKAEKGRKTSVYLPKERPCSVSGNNVDGFIITEWRKTHGCKGTLRRT